MYFENSKKSYYRFPSKASATEFDAQIPYYFPTIDAFSDTTTTSKSDTTSADRNTTHTETTSAADNTVH